MPTYTAVGTKNIAYRISVIARTKTEATRKIRDGDVNHIRVINEPKGFMLSGGGHAGVTEVKQ